MDTPAAKLCVSIAGGRRSGGSSVPRAVACLERDGEERLSFFTVPQAHWRKVCTTHVIERCFREVRRRVRPISSFTNPAGCDRIIIGVISRLNRSWGMTP